MYFIGKYGIWYYLVCFEFDICINSYWLFVLKGMLSLKFYLFFFLVISKNSKRGKINGGDVLICL